jgi:hypothetical protein
MPKRCFGTFGKRTKQPLPVKPVVVSPTPVSSEAIADQAPNEFFFIDASSVALTSLQTSNTIIVSGLGSGVTVDVTLSGDASSEVQRNSGVWTSGAVVAVNGDTFAVRHTSSASFAAAVTTTLTIGDVSGTFTSTTQTAAGSDDGSLDFSRSGTAALVLFEDI